MLGTSHKSFLSVSTNDNLGKIISLTSKSGREIKVLLGTTHGAALNQYQDHCFVSLLDHINAVAKELDRTVPYEIISSMRLY